MSVPVEISAVRLSSSSTSGSENERTKEKGTGLEDVGEVEVVRVATNSHLQDRFAVLDIVQHDLLHLREVPAIPLFHTHRVDVDLLVQLVQQTDRLHNHRVHLVCAELQLVATQAVRKTQDHRMHVLRSHRIDESIHLVTNASHELVNTCVVDTFDVQLFFNQTCKLGIGNGKLILERGLDNRFL